MISRLSAIAAVASALTFACAPAFATPIVYQLTNVNTSAGSLTGSVTIDSSTDKVTAANITFNDSAAGNPLYNNINSPSLNAYNGIGIDYISGAHGQLALYYETANIGTGNLKICVAGGTCGNPNDPQTSYSQIYVSPYATYDILSGGTLSAPSAAAPEPSSLLLLGSGVLTGAAAVRRRLRRA